MAELNSSAGSLRGKGRTSTLSPKVDMTPMVDLMFLLITFFMLTTSLAKPFMMPLAMPVKASPGMEIADSRTMNLCIGKDNRIQWYMGKAENPLTAPEVTSLSTEGLREVLKSQNQSVQGLTGSREKGVIALIKPTDRSNYKNLVDVLDELKITGIENYMIVGTMPIDIERMKRSAIY
ncbi:ExbD/TolR family protein [Desertivirga brevis]|uniref:ExbD/TolR family protein n=1 Tax=Desertivirga brevis TaxID=2810310 RepID=UPI001A9609BF|nr:biopolymer transporter ExbD [Pedobacter sp. SYSU D00873]